jgi:hypothetical protein
MKTIANHRHPSSTTANRAIGAFDPTLPQDGALIIAGVLRDQFNSLFSLIQNIPAGPPGPQGVPGIQGPPFAQAVVDGVTTLVPGDPAWVTVSFDGTDVHFGFGIPRGDAGAQGQPGAQGPPFAQAEVNGVTTLPPGSDAWVTTSFDGSNVHFTFGIPRGDAGEQGQPGIQGPPGEVTAAQLNAAIAGTSANTNAVATLDTPFADPDSETLRQKVNEMILNGRR